MSRLDHGQIDLELGGETVTLKPTLGAMQSINRRFGSLREAITKVESLDFDAISFILAAGLDRKDVAQAAFETGVINLLEPVTSYLLALMNPSGREAQGEGKA